MTINGIFFYIEMKEVTDRIYNIAGDHDICTDICIYHFSLSLRPYCYNICFCYICITADIPALQFESSNFQWGLH